VKQPLVVDANPLISALLGGRADSLIASGNLELYSTQFTLFEVAKYLPRLATLLECSELDLFSVFEELPVEACQPDIYNGKFEHAQKLIGGRDERDVPLLALALTLGYPVWSDDRDFEGIVEIELLKTADLAARLLS